MNCQFINVYTVVLNGSVVAANLLSLEEAQGLGGEIYSQQAMLIDGELYI